jgi:hypothetical protein
MPSPSMIACGLSLPHRARMKIAGVKFGKKLMKSMSGTGAYKKDMPMMAASGHAPTRTLKFR